jgi:LysM repeat protein
MRALREIFGGLFLAALTTLAVFGGIVIALSESGTPLVQITSAATSAPVSVTNTPAQPATPAPPTLSATETSQPTQTALPQLTDTPSPTAPAATDTPPAADAPATLSSTPCGPPATWVRYTVRRGDTLFDLSRRFGVSQSELQLANCLTDANIKFGQNLFVPFVPSPTPTETPLPSDTPPPTPIPDTLRIIDVILVNVVRDASRPNGAIASVQIVFSGGAPPYRFYDENVPQPDNPVQALTECDAALIHTVRVDSADGQTVSQKYFFSPIICP